MGIINGYKAFDAEHCETSATKFLLQNEDLKISEPMMLGLSSGFGFIYWKMSFMNLPFIGGRAKPFELTRKFCENIGLEVDEKQTSSTKKAWSNLFESIDSGVPVGLQLDCYHLEHFKHSFHFAGHFISVYGYDTEYAYVFDTGKLYKVSLENLEKARFEKGSMAGKARSYTIKKTGSTIPFQNAIPPAIRVISHDFLNPPLKCFGFLGIEKLGHEMKTWLKTVANPRRDLLDQADLMENGGTGGAIFRNFFTSFLIESLEYLPGNTILKKSAELYRQAASNWTEIAQLIIEAGNTCTQMPLDRAADLCLQTAAIEKEAMEMLSNI